MGREARLRAGGSRWIDVRTEARCGEEARDLASIGVLTYRLSLRWGVLFLKLSKLLNQGDALSAPCFSRAPSRAAPRPAPRHAPRHAGAGGAGETGGAADGLNPSLLMSNYCLLHPTHHADKR
jgi:hypothetical protein